MEKNNFKDILTSYENDDIAFLKVLQEETFKKHFLITCITASKIAKKILLENNVQYNLVFLRSKDSNIGFSFYFENIQYLHTPIEELIIKNEFVKIFSTDVLDNIYRQHFRIIYYPGIDFFKEFLINFIGNNEYIKLEKEIINYKIDSNKNTQTFKI